MLHKITRYSAMLAISLLLIGSASLLGGRSALANDGFDPNIQRAIRNAGIFAVSPCNGESVSTAGLTTTVYDVDFGRRGLELKVSASFTGTGVGSLGDTYRLTVDADRSFRTPTVGDPYNGYFDLAYTGIVNGPDRLDYRVRGTWRVFIVNGQPLSDQVLSLQGDCGRDRHDDNNNRRDNDNNNRRDDHNDRHDRDDNRHRGWGE